MDTLNFLQRVLPTTGLYVAATITKDGGTRQGFFDTVEELAQAVVSLDQRGQNTYFAISAFVEKGNRKQSNVRATKVFALDVDCGTDKPFPSWKAGLLALSKFVEELKLPRPLIIHSGNGLHVYWVLTEELESHQWKPIAEAMKAAARDKNFEIDMAVPADSARILRPVGTKNPKGGNTVKMLLDAPDVTVGEVAAALSDYMVAQPVSYTRSTTTSALSQALQVTSEFPPSNATVIVTKCQQISWAVNNQGAVEEPLWYGLMGVAAHCQDPEAVAIAWSENHPKYDVNVTLQKLSQWKQVTTGPTTCKKFDELRPSGCKGCKFREKVGSPARLGIQYVEVAPSATAPANAAVDIAMPRPFKRTKDGVKMTIDDTDIDVCKFDIYPVSYGRDESLGYETVRFQWNRPHAGWQELVMRQAALTEGYREFPTILADQGIVLYNKHQTGHFQLMLRSYMDELRHMRSMTNLYTTMGWKENFSRFVIGDTMLRRNLDGTVSSEDVSLASGSSRQGSELWGTAGTLQEWVDFTSILDKAKLNGHKFALAVGLSAPLYAFTGLKGLTVSLYGPTGGGKTLAQMWVQSIYGNPDKLHFAAKYTQNTLFGRMGLYAHMPMTIDEVTMMDNKEVGDFAYWVSQGRDKARLNRNAEERDAKNWAMPVIISTNKSMHSKLIASGLETDAQLARILELSVPPSRVFSKDSLAGRKMYQFVNNNYGHVGRAFISKLIELGEAGIRAAIEQATVDFRAKYKASFSGEERFYEQAVVLADLAARWANEWGLAKYEHESGINWVLAQLGAIRRSVADMKTDAFDMLTEYMNENADATLTVAQTGTNKPTVDFSRVPRGELRIRFELHRKTSGDVFTHGIVMLDRTHLRRWLSQRGTDYKSFMAELHAENVVATPKSNKAYLGKDSPIKLGQSYVVGVNLVHPRLQGILSDADQAIDDLAYGQIKSVASTV